MNVRKRKGCLPHVKRSKAVTYNSNQKEVDYCAVNAEKNVNLTGTINNTIKPCPTKVNATAICSLAKVERVTLIKVISKCKLEIHDLPLYSTTNP